jgi:riboflavin kinase/FMN adenylyltransferase
MQVHRSIEELPPFSNSVITIGTFDGVHLGHKKLIDALITEASSARGESVIITFEPHPRKIINPAEHLQLINTLDEKIELLSGTGVDHLVVVPFTKAFAEQSADQYVENFLIEKFHPHTVIIGYDHHFGKGRQGNFLFLAGKADQYGYRLLEIPKYILDEIGVSSTKIRTALMQSDIETANKLLGYDFFFSGNVVRGDQLGRELGYPTANLEYNDADKIHLGDGVYAAFVDVEGEVRKGMLSIGNRPTLTNSEQKVEVNIFDGEKDFYVKTLRITAKKFLRQQEKYDSLEELVQQLGRDREESLRVL